MQHVVEFVLPYLQSTQDTPLCLIYDLGFAVLDSIGDLNLNGKQIFLVKHCSGLTARGETTRDNSYLRNKNFSPVPQKSYLQLSLVLNKG